jgi:hypothetical protein
VIYLTLFGTTTGLEVLHLPIGSTSLPIKFEDAWIEISSNMATLRPERDVLVLNRRQINDHVATWVGLYRPAREIGYDRPGSFYGAGAWLIDQVADVTILIETLKNLADQLQALAMNGERFVKRIVDIHSQLVPPDQISNLSSSLSNVAAGCNVSGETIFIATNNSYSEVLNWAQQAQSASKFSRIIIGSPNQAPELASGSSIQIFSGLTFAIDAAYQKSNAEFHNALLQNKSTIQQYDQLLEKLRKEKDDFDQTLKLQNLQVQDAHTSADKWMKYCQELESEKVLLLNKIAFYQQKSQGSKQIKAKTSSNENNPADKKIYFEDESLTPLEYLLRIATAVLAVAIIVVFFKSIWPEKACAISSIFCQADNENKLRNSSPEPSKIEPWQP